MEQLNLEPAVESRRTENLDFRDESKEPNVKIQKDAVTSTGSNRESKPIFDNQTSKEAERSSTTPRGCRTRRVTSPVYDLHSRCRGPIDDDIPSKAPVGPLRMIECPTSHSDYLREFDAGVDQLSRWTIRMRKMQEEDGVGFDKAVNALRSERGDNPLGEWAGKIQFMLNTVRDVKNEFGQEQIRGPY